MKLRNLIIAGVAATMPLCGAAQEKWLHIYNVPVKTDYDKETGEITRPKRKFVSLPWSEIDSIRFKPNSKGYYLSMRVYASDKSEYASSFPSIDHWTVGPNVPEINFTITDFPTLDDVESKEEYLDCRMTINGRGVYDDFESDAIRVRGRGNSTWNFPKKAYRIKLPEKTKLCGFRKAKNYVLLANYIDLSFMRNLAACLATQYVGMPYPTHAVPVDVKFNNRYKGSYMLIEKVGVNNGSVNLSKEDEANTCMFELDTSFDEDLRAPSVYFNLPVMHKDPDAPEGVDPKEWFASWLDDFTEMESAVYYRKGMADQIDYTTLAKYLLCYNLACNQELNHPKSLYLYKTKGEGQKYQFGPCWDFDWAFGYRPTYKHETGEPISEDTARSMIEGAKAYMEANGIEQYWMFTYDGYSLIWFGGDDFRCYNNGVFSDWPYGMKEYTPSYQNFLLGAGQNQQNTADGMGNGGEFLLSIIMDNPEFMETYRQVWEDFKQRLPEFRADFDAYVKAVEPSAERDATVWDGNYYSPYVDLEFEDREFSHAGAVEILRKWLEKRIEFIDNPKMNYGLYDPATTYVPPFKKQD